jgi:hypothetical protein
LVYYVAIWYIMWPFGILCGHLVYYVAIWYIMWPFGILHMWPFGIFCGHLVYFSRFGKLYQEKYGDPVQDVDFLVQKSCRNFTIL